MVDIGVDAVVRGQDGSYTELQVKATEAENQDRFFICVSLKDAPPSVWVIPWDVFKEYAQKQKLAVGDRWYLPLPERRRGDLSGKTREEMLEPYCASKHPDAWLPLIPPP